MINEARASDPNPTAAQPDSGHKHVLLTKRDVDLMVSLHDHVVLSFGQIQRRHFAGRSIATAMNRLKRIEDRGFIVRTRVPRLHLFGSTNATGVVFQLSAKGRTTLASYRPSMHVFDKCPTLSPHQLEHDLLIGDIAGFFQRQFPSCRWINGRYLMDRDGINKIPDAVLQMADSNKVIAIELELSGKSVRRYREIVAVLRGSHRIAKVIFVTSNTVIGRRIMSAIEGYPVPEGHVLRSDLFEFMRLSECLKAKKL